ncbi:MAG TPA: NAD(P)-dependent oxidoreductase [Polyangiales bacterium]|nr:NAD(P)-dependent oxidoreductase [Polyangiales bacterium]
MTRPNADAPWAGHAVAVLGAGIMGSAMASALERAGVSVSIYNRTPERASALEGPRVRVARTPMEAASGAATVISCVRDDAASDVVWFGPAGAVHGMRAGAVGIECSTLSVRCVDRWAARLTERGLKALDCPVTGSKSAAAAGSLTLFLGGRAQEYPEVEPVLKALSSQQFWLGAAGRGMRFKMLYNQLGGTILVALAEALALGQAYGLDLNEVVEALSQNTNGWSASAAASKGRSMVRGQHEPVACAVQTMVKDLTYAREDAQRFQLDLPAAGAALGALQGTVANGLGACDMSAVAQGLLRQHE